MLGHCSNMVQTRFFNTRLNSPRLKILCNKIFLTTVKEVAESYFFKEHMNDNFSPVELLLFLVCILFSHREQVFGVHKPSETQYYLM